MNTVNISGLFVAEGPSDDGLAEIVEQLFFDHGVPVYLSRPDYSLLPKKVGRDVASQVRTGIQLLGYDPDLIVVHRDAENLDPAVRRQQILSAAGEAGYSGNLLCVVPVRMTEAWLLLDENNIRHVAGNPNGRTQIQLPKIHEVESRADPKEILRTCLLEAADVTGRRRIEARRRFPSHRRQLLERLDRNGPVRNLPSWSAMLTEIADISTRLLGG